MDEGKLAEDFWRAIQYTEEDRQALSAFVRRTAALARGGLVTYFETCGLKGTWAAEEIRTRWAVLPTVRAEREDYPALVRWIAAVARAEIAEYFEGCGEQGGWAAEEIRRWLADLPVQVCVGPDSRISVGSDAVRDVRRYLDHRSGALFRQMAARSDRAPRVTDGESTPWPDDEADAAEVAALKKVHAAAALQRLGR